MTGSILTAVGKAKIASATPENQLEISHVAVGDGNGSYPVLTENMVALANEVWRGNASNPIRDVSATNTLMFESAIPPDVGGFTIREIAIFDSTGAMIAIGHVDPAQIKPLATTTTAVNMTVRMIIALANAEETNLILQIAPIATHNGLADRDSAGAHPASAIADASGDTQQNVNLKGAAPWYAKPGGYNTGDKVALSTGYIVKSIANGNTNNPNSNMTGWVKVNDSSQIDIKLNELASSIQKSLYDAVYDELIDVTWFGANGNWNKDTQTGSNSTAAVQNAIAYLATLGTRRQGGKRGLKFPKGSYRVDNFSLISALGFGLDIIGDGPKTTNIYFDQNSLDPAITSEIEFVQFRNMSLIGALDEVWNTTRTPMYKGRLPDGRADIDVSYVNCEIICWNIASQIHGRGCTYEACSLGLVISGMDIVVEDYTHGVDTDLMQSKFATMRHYNYRNCRFDNCSRAYTVSGSGEMMDFINNGLFIGNDITNMDLLIEAPNAQFVNWCIGGNTGLGSFATSVLKAKAFHMTGAMGNNFTKSTNYNVAPTSNLNSIEFFFDVTAPCTNLTAYGNTIRGLRGAFYKNTSASPSKNVSFYGNSLPEFGAWKGGNSSISFMLNTANHLNLLVKDNSFSCSNIAGTFYLFNAIGSQLAKDVIFKDNTAPFTWSDRVFSNTPTIYVNGVATAGTSSIKTHQYITDGDYVEGHMYFSGTVPESSGAVTISLPVAAIALATAFGSVPSGSAKIITASGVVSTGFVFADALVNASTQRIELRKQKDMTFSAIDAGDIPAIFSAVLEYKYRFK